MISMTPIIITGIVCVLFGIALGSVITTLIKDSRQKSEQNLIEGDWIEIVKWVTDKEGVNLYPQLQGKVYLSEKDLPPKLRQFLSKTIAKIRTWMGEPEQTLQPASSSPPTASSVPPVKESGIAATPEVIPGSQAPASAKPNLNPIEFFAKAVQSDVKKAEPPKSIVAQIDEILQEKLEESPLGKRGIRLLELPGKGMVVMVGLEQYSGVDEVPDEEIQKLIRSSAKEWENRIESK